MYPFRSNTPNAMSASAAAVSNPRTKIRPAPRFDLARRPANPRGPTAILAIAATVMAVPTPITKVAATPVQNRPCASARSQCCKQACGTCGAGDRMDVSRRPSLVDAVEKVLRVSPNSDSAVRQVVSMDSASMPGCRRIICSGASTFL
jgi:hypothetical protein